MYNISSYDCTHICTEHSWFGHKRLHVENGFWQNEGPRMQYSFLKPHDHKEWLERMKSLDKLRNLEWFVDASKTKDEIVCGIQGRRPE